MPESPNRTTVLKHRVVKCPHCGSICLPQATQCPECHKAIDSSTEQIERRPVLLPVAAQGTDRFEDHFVAVLQLLPSGACLSVPLRSTAILGRAGASEPDYFVDLGNYNALPHGVSRRHCQLQRRDQHLVVTDLGSSNSTYLNNERILPYQDHIVADGDRLILGTLHIRVFFSPVPAPPTSR